MIPELPEDREEWWAEILARLAAWITGARARQHGSRIHPTPTNEGKENEREED